jgi:hypothetical protein
VPVPRRARLGLAALAASLAALAVSAGANAGILVSSAPSCDDDPGSAVFAPWVDPFNYVPNGGGSFENGAAGWDLNGASTVPGNEPWRVRGDDGRASLRIPAGSSATSAVQCVGLEHPTLRFFAKRTGGGFLGGLSSMSVEVLAETTLGLVVSVPIGVVVNDGSWQPTLPMAVIANLLPLLPGEHTPVAFRFTPLGTATWQIDDVYVDPRSGG